MAAAHQGADTTRGWAPLDSWRGGAPNVAEVQRPPRQTVADVVRMADAWERREARQGRRASRKATTPAELEQRAARAEAERLRAILASHRHASPFRLQHVCRVTKPGRLPRVLFEVESPSLLRSECLRRGWRFESEAELLAQRRQDQEDN